MYQEGKSAPLNYGHRMSFSLLFQDKVLAFDEKGEHLNAQPSFLETVAMNFEDKESEKNQNLLFSNKTFSQKKVHKIQINVKLYHNGLFLARYNHISILKDYSTDLSKLSHPPNTK